ncbi:MAG: hypothetical protein P4L33_15970 [Capsulimonadaceae bacterium]|nr:hypothetical protein [Capsulimonadaceae bacterium]
METLIVLIVSVIRSLIEWVMRDPQHAIPILIVAWVLWQVLKAAGAWARATEAETDTAPPSSPSAQGPALRTSDAMRQEEFPYRPQGPAAGPPTSVFENESSPSTASSVAIASDREKQAAEDRAKLAAAPIITDKRKPGEAAGWKNLDKRLESLGTNKAGLVRALILAQALERPSGRRAIAAGPHRPARK